MKYNDEDYICRTDNLVSIALQAGYKFIDNVVDPKEYPDSSRKYRPVKFFIERQESFVPDLSQVRNLARISKVNEKYALREISSQSSKEILLPAYAADKGGAQVPINLQENGFNMYALFKLEK